ncbi:alpha/beta fold hydrolase [[Limnothrix rosea] IAM M-220]|uniref:alpha/beta fold hydrolase n=1 Tax=[Limnothrix rosea] IAM M-220 TaxID=454133 RepID=UPI000960FA41|nr:alpha/beta fold hydrolase [[Limnothrix rosea] IAM M-220]OKH12942.1 alpha/beta hydrolase [[Limnothrix rosea] IAM M-220]
MTQTPVAPQTLVSLDWRWRDQKICYTVQGEGQPLLLIHGFGASIGHWKHNIPVLAEEGYQVFAIDLLGFGASAKPAWDYTLELWQELLHDFWQAKIQKPTVFIGNSIGGLLSLSMLANYPELCAGGVLVNCAGGLNHRPDELALPLRAVMGAFAKLVSSPLTGKLIFNEVRRKFRIKGTLYQVYGDRQAVTDELVDMLYAPSCDEGAQAVFASVITAPPGESPTELLPKRQHPLLVLWGDKDPWTPIKGSQIYQDLAAANEGVEFHPIPGAGHCPHDENPTLVNALILDWLSRQAN